MPAPDVVIRSRRVVSARGVGPAAIHVHAGKIVGVLDHADVPPGVPLEDLQDLAVMPGLVDPHVHVNEPGRADWEGFEAATRAAAAGGVTTFIDMPLGGMPTTSPAALEAKRGAAARKCYVNVGFWGGLAPGRGQDLAGLWEAGVYGFKCVLVPSDVPGFSHVTEGDLREALPHLAHVGARLLAHAELPGPIEAAVTEDVRGRLERRLRLPQRQYRRYLASRPSDAENEAVTLLVGLSGEFRVPIHIVHLSSAETLTPLYRAKAARLPITVETCPHYLFFVADEIPDGATLFKCAPPIRERENRELLWGALSGGLIDFIASDHSPSPPAAKHLLTGDFRRAWAGISSLQLSLSVVWTEARARGYGLDRLATWLCDAPARMVGLRRKGRIDVGYDADLVAWRPEAAFRVDPSSLQHRHKRTPYEGRELRGKVEATFLAGQRTWSGGAVTGRPRGRLLARDA
jgi:allantoinase